MSQSSVATYTRSSEATSSLEEELEQDDEPLAETAEEWPEDTPKAKPLSDADRAAIEKEIADLETFRKLAVSITSLAIH